MSMVVKKFGGTSLGDISRLQNVAKKIAGFNSNGTKLAIVVSAMGELTDTLVEQYKKISLQPGAEYDAVVSAGEQISAGLLAQELQNMGVAARSWLGWQVPILTSGCEERSQIESIKTDQLLADIEAKTVPIVTGFQGVDENNRITTLGRGGSDLTAVALAVALGADKCDIYTDVPGVYEADPKIKGGKKLESITYNEMLGFIDQGARVVERRAVNLAKKHNLKLEVRSSFENVSGTIISN